MNDFQEQAKNWLRNVVNKNPDKIKAGVEKAGDLIDKQTGGKYADKVDAVQQKTGEYVDSQSSDGTASQPQADTDRSSSPGAPESTDTASTGAADTSPESEGGLPGPR